MEGYKSWDPPIKEVTSAFLSLVLRFANCPSQILPLVMASRPAWLILRILTFSTYEGVLYL
jgi:hypothetical protein